MIEQLITQLRRQMNGAVSQTMRQMGQQDYINFGVSLPTIKEIALQYAPNHSLACELSVRRLREARIAALYIADVDELTMEQVELWSSDWRNEEIARLTAMVLLYRSSLAQAVIEKWISGEQDELRRVAALYTAGKIANALNEDMARMVVDRADDSSAAVFALREIYCAHSGLRDIIKQKADGIDDLRWQLAEV